MPALAPENPAWLAAQAAVHTSSQRHLRELFRAEPDRARACTLSAATGDGPLQLDFSKQRLDQPARQRLLELAEAADLAGWRRELFAGAAVNHTEGRAALHTALRRPNGPPLYVGEQDIRGDIQAVLDQMRRFVGQVRAGTWTGATGRPIRSVVNLGIGGSDLGPRMAATALAPYGDGPALRFVSNVDPSDLHEALSDLDPATTLVVVVSKTFTTQETLTNARAARAWLTAALGEDAVARHFVAVSTNRAAVASFGIDPANMFVFWDWVGGRYSLWSAVGLALALQVGMADFEALLAGAAALDDHFADTPLAANLPVWLGLLGVANTNFLGAGSHAVIPYDRYLAQFPAHLQQLEMESNGKRIDRDGRVVGAPSAPVLWGAPGTDAQHSFFQLLHQGARLVPVDFLAPAWPQHGDRDGHAKLLANCFAQSRALAFGRSYDEARAAIAGRSDLDADRKALLAANRTFPGNQPSTTILYPRVTPRVLGALVALYEHKVFVQGILWHVNSFDQYGVELGKELAKGLLPAIGDPDAAGAVDASTRNLLDSVANWNRP